MLACSLHVAGLSHTEFDPQQPSFIQIDTERSGRLQRKRPNLGVYSCAPGRPCRFCALVWLGGVVCSLACVRVCMGSREYLRGMQLFLDPGRLFRGKVTCLPPLIRANLSCPRLQGPAEPKPPLGLRGHAVPSVVALPLVVRRRPYWHCAIVPCSSPAPTPVADSPCRNTLKSEHAHGRWMYPWRSSSRGTSSTSSWATCRTSRSIPTSPPRRAMRGWA